MRGISKSEDEGRKRGESAKFFNEAKREDAPVRAGPQARTEADRFGFRAGCGTVYRRRGACAARCFDWIGT